MSELPPLSVKKKKKLKQKNLSLPKSQESCPPLDPSSTAAPESSFGGEPKLFVLLVSDTGETRMVFADDAETLAAEAHTEINELGAEAGLRIYAFRGVRLPVTKKRVELVLEDGSRVPLLRAEEVEEIPEDACVLATDEPAEAEVTGETGGMENSLLGGGDGDADESWDPT